MVARIEPHRDCRRPQHLREYRHKSKTIHNRSQDSSC